MLRLLTRVSNHARCTTSHAIRPISTTSTLLKAPENRTGPEGSNVEKGDAYDPKKLTDGISQIEGKESGKGEAAPTKEPTRSTGIKQG